MNVKAHNVSAHVIDLIERSFGDNTVEDPVLTMIDDDVHILICVRTSHVTARHMQEYVEELFEYVDDDSGECSITFNDEYGPRSIVYISCTTKLEAAKWWFAASPMHCAVDDQPCNFEAHAF